MIQTQVCLCELASMPHNWFIWISLGDLKGYTVHTLTLGKQKRQSLVLWRQWPLCLKTKLLPAHCQLGRDEPWWFAFFSFWGWWKTHYAAQAGLRFQATLLPQPPKYRGNRCELPHLALALQRVRMGQTALTRINLTAEAFGCSVFKFTGCGQKMHL